MSSLAAPPDRGPAAAAAAAPPAFAPPPWWRPGSDVLLTVGLAALLSAVAFSAEGGLRVTRTAPVEMALLLGGGLSVAAAALLAPRRTRVHGLAALVAFAGLAALTALSITWSINPSDSWLETNRTLAYLAVFAGAVALAHTVPDRWNAVLGAITLSAVVISAYALATKVFPEALGEDDIYARLRAPFSYWNATGLAAALGVPGCLWLGSRRSGHQALNALAYPALGLLLTVVMLSYSRGALLAAGVGAAFFFAVVPLRIRAAAVLIAGATGAAAVSGWVFTQDALTSDLVPLDIRETAGHQLGLLVVVVLGVLAMIGLATAFAALRQPLPALLRRRVAIGLFVLLALLPVAALGRLATTDRGVKGSLSHTVDQLTDPDSTLPANTPGRFTSAGSARAEYWDEALRIGKDNTWIGVGAGGFATARPRYADRLEVRHAHGHLLQAYADLGIVGLAATLLLLLAWAVPATRAAGLRRRELRRPFDSERVGMVALLAVALVFGVHSLVDWTWFVPANAVVAMLAAGWVAGRARSTTGPAPVTLDRLRAGVRSRRRVIGAVTAIVVALVAAWTAWQPMRSIAKGQDALDALDAGNVDRARTLALEAHDHNPLALSPYFELSAIELSAGRPEAGLSALRQAVRMQPENRDPWLRLAQYQLSAMDNPRGALAAVRPALYLDPRNKEAADVFFTATRLLRGS